MKWPALTALASVGKYSEGHQVSEDGPVKLQWRYFLLAVCFFTRLPVPALPDFQEAELNHAARYFPLVGLLVGLMAAVTWWLASWVLPPALAVLCSMAATIYVTGAFHEDGLADSADGLGGGIDRARQLEIMQDSRLGSYGAIALVGVLLFKFQALCELTPAILPFRCACPEPPGSGVYHGDCKLCAVCRKIQTAGDDAHPAGSVAGHYIWFAVLAGICRDAGCKSLGNGCD